MPPTGWPTDDQKDWLEDRNDAAIEARRTGAYSKWITATLHDWFLLWSEKTRLFGTFTGKLTPEQEAELGKATRHKQEVRTTDISLSSNVLSRPPAPSAIRSDLATGKASRAPQAREVYCRMYYDEDKQAVVNQELTAEREVLGRTLTKSETMAISRRLIDGFFDEEPEDVKEEIQTRVDEVKAARKAPPPPDDPNRKRTPEEYQNAIDAAPRIITKLLTPVHEDSGWCFSVVGAGPSPRHGGAIKSFAYVVHHALAARSRLTPVQGALRDQSFRPYAG
ncbi:hypothetical protein OH76DRAFT_1361680 [Lentinus brumalis]|uniref:Uncharacterized protein n=1 Tax=Lentinus brumalis TaxID=2498619 RepID=A0A371CS46_9APHY|nr:hypothetical protein OH76DRAFT_1361680 [Polyporus brumalis]